MRDVNLSLRQAYHGILSGNVTVRGVEVPIYYLQVPDKYPDMYIVIQGINSVGVESKCDTDVSTSIQFAIFTRLERNSAWECDQIAGQIYELVYPNRQSKIPGCLSIELVNDNTLGDLDAAGVKQIVERIITFNHIITI